MSFQATVETFLFGTTFDDVMDRIRKLSRTVDDVSARIDTDVATIRKDIRCLDVSREADIRDGLFIIEDDCISCEVCTDLAPEAYAMRDDGIAVVTDPYALDLDRLQETIESCGGSCIKVAS